MQLSFYPKPYTHLVAIGTEINPFASITSLTLFQVLPSPIRGSVILCTEMPRSSNIFCMLSKSSRVSSFTLRGASATFVWEGQQKKSGICMSN